MKVSFKGKEVGVIFASARAKLYNHTWEIVECCALTNRRDELLFLKVVVKFSVDGLGGVGVI